MTQEVLVEKAQITREHLAKVETGKKYPSLQLIFRLADLLNVKEEEFFKF